MLAAPMSRDLGVSTPLVFAAFSVAMLVSAPLGPLAGRAIDRHGGHVVLPELPGIGFEGKADLYREMSALAS